MLRVVTIIIINSWVQLKLLSSSPPSSRPLVFSKRQGSRAAWESEIEGGLDGLCQQQVFFGRMKEEPLVSPFCFSLPQWPLTGPVTSSCLLLLKDMDVDMVDQL